MPKTELISKHFSTTPSWPRPSSSPPPAPARAGPGHQEPPQLPPSPAVTQGVVRPSSSPSLQAATLTNEKMETSESGAAPAPAPRPGPKQLQSPGSSPDTDQDSDFVLVPNSLAGDSSRNKNMHAGRVSPMTARRIGSRPGSLPVINKPGHSAEPIPV